MSSCHHRIPLWLQGLPSRPPVRSEAPPCPLLSITAWQVSERTASEWRQARKPGVHRCNWLPTWQIACFICKRGRKRGAPWDLSALQRAGTACGHGAGKPGPSKGPCRGWISKQWIESSWRPQSCICSLVLSGDHRVTEQERTLRHLCHPLLFYRWGNKDTEG